MYYIVLFSTTLCFEPQQIKSRARENNVHVEVMRKAIITKYLFIFQFMIIWFDY